MLLAENDAQGTFADHCESFKRSPLELPLPPRKGRFEEVNQIALGVRFAAISGRRTNYV